MKRFVWMGCAAYLLIGFAHVVVGSVLPELMDYYRLRYQDGGTILFLQFAGFLIGVLGTPRMIRHIGGRSALLSASCILAAAELFYFLLPGWIPMLVAAPFAGVGFGMIEAVVGSVIIGGIKEKSASAMSRIEVFFGLGALLIPLLAGLFIHVRYWQGAFLLTGVLAAVMALVWARVSFGELDSFLARPLKGADTPHFSGFYRGTGRLFLTLFILYFAVYVGLEMSFVNFLPSLFIERFGSDKAFASTTVTWFWLTMSLGRLFAGSIAERRGYARYLIVGCAGTFLFLGLLSFGVSTGAAVALVLLTGLLMSGIFAISLVYANSLMPGTAQLTTSLLIGAGGLGGAILPYSTGWGMDVLGADKTQVMLGLFALLLLLLIVGIRTLEQLRGESPERNEQRVNMEPQNLH